MLWYNGIFPQILQLLESTIYPFFFCIQYQYNMFANNAVSRTFVVQLEFIPAQTPEFKLEPMLYTMHVFCS